MISLAKYAFTNSRVRAMLSSLLDDSQIQSLLSAKDIDEFFFTLKSTSYEPIVGKLRAPYDLKEAEQILFADSVEKHKKIIKNLKGIPKEVVFLLLSRYEIENLKNIIRIWDSGIEQEEEEYLYEDKICYNIPVSDILSAENIEEIILLLDKTPYKDALMGAKDKFKKEGSLFYLEVALDIDFYKRLNNKIQRLSSSDKKQASKLIGAEIDIQNISWVVRFKKYYKMPLGQLLSYIIPGGYKISRPLITKAYSSDDMKSLVGGLSAKPYQDINTLLSSGYDKSKMFMLEVVLWEVLLKQSRLSLAGFPFTIGTVIAYLILYRAQAKNIVSMLYSKVYEWDSEKIKGNLI